MYILMNLRVIDSKQELELGNLFGDFYTVCSMEQYILGLIFVYGITYHVSRNFSQIY